MKIRNGFVSNSSSSSFCIYGTYVEGYEGYKGLYEIFKNDIEDADDFDDYELGELIDEKTNLETHAYDQRDGMYIGKSWSSVKDDQTGKQFKEEVEAELKKIGIEDKCETREEAWMDG